MEAREFLSPIPLTPFLCHHSPIIGRQRNGGKGISLSHSFDPIPLSSKEWRQGNFSPPFPLAPFLCHHSPIIGGQRNGGKGISLSHSFDPIPLSSLPDHWRAKEWRQGNFSPPFLWPHSFAITLRSLAGKGMEAREFLSSIPLTPFLCHHSPIIGRRRNGGKGISLLLSFGPIPLSSLSDHWRAKEWRQGNFSLPFL
jgi:hypothetical protein